MMLMRILIRIIFYDLELFFESVLFFSTNFFRHDRNREDNILSTDAKSVNALATSKLAHKNII